MVLLVGMALLGVLTIGTVMGVAATGRGATPAVSEWKSFSPPTAARSAASISRSVSCSGRSPAHSEADHARP